MEDMKRLGASSILFGSNSEDVATSFDKELNDSS